MNQFIKDCLSNIAKNSEAISAASQGINTAVIGLVVDDQILDFQNGIHKHGPPSS